MKVLIVAAHPDDEVLGCGATATRLVREGAELTIAILGEGATSRARDRSLAAPSEAARLRGQAEAAGRVLGAREVLTFGLPDNRFDSLPLLDVVKVVEELVARVRPDVVFTHHGGDLNIDHQITNRAVLTATRPTAGHPVRELYAFEVPSSTEWAFQRLEPCFRPDVFFDVGSTLESKIAAMAVYDTEARPFPHPRSPEALRAIAKRWGSVVGAEAAEAFEAVRVLK